MSFIDDLTKAGSIFQQGLSDIRTLQAAKDASAAVEAIKLQEVDERGKALKEIDKRARIQQVANNFAMELALTGASPAQAQLLLQGVSPSRPLSGVEMIREGFAAGEDQSTIAKGVRLRDLENPPTVAPAAGLSDKAIETITSIDDMLVETQGLLNTAKENEDFLGREEAFIPGFAVSDKQEAFRKRVKGFILSYQKSISGAQVTDKEREYIQEATISDSDDPQVFKETLRRLLAIGKRARTRYLQKQQTLGQKQVSPDAFVAPTDEQAQGALDVSRFIRRR